MTKYIAPINPTGMWQALRHVPFTLLLLATMGVVALWTDTHVGELSTRWLNRLGFAPRDLWLWHWWRLISSAVVTSGGWVFVLAIGMIALAVGVTEWQTGTWCAAATFWGVHLLTLLIQSLLIALPLHTLNIALGTALFVARDVGPSAGYVGCVGLVCAKLPNPWRQTVSAAIWVGLIAVLLSSTLSQQNVATKVTADLAHAIAFPLGWGAAALYARSVAHKSH